MKVVVSRGVSYGVPAAESAWRGERIPRRRCLTRQHALFVVLILQERAEKFIGAQAFHGKHSSYVVHLLLWDGTGRAEVLEGNQKCLLGSGMFFFIVFVSIFDHGEVLDGNAADV